MSNPSAIKGKKWERDALHHARDQGHDIERLRDTGAKDEGDLALRTGLLTLVLEAKAEKRITLADYMNQADVESAHYSANRLGIPVVGAALVKRSRHGTGKGYTIFNYDDILRLTRALEVLYSGASPATRAAAREALEQP